MLPSKFTGNSFTLTSTDPLCVKFYSSYDEDFFAVGFGQLFGKDWIHVESHSRASLWEEYKKMSARAPEHVRSMDKARSRARACFMQIPLDYSTLHTCVVEKSSTESGVKLEAFLDPGFGYVSGEWMSFDVDVSGISSHYFRNGNDITHRKQKIKPFHIAMPHSKLMTAQSPRVASPIAAHTQRNSQEIVSF